VIDHYSGMLTPEMTPKDAKSNNLFKVRCNKQKTVVEITGMSTPVDFEHDGSFDLISIQY
jgi:hypothetical protein